MYSYQPSSNINWVAGYEGARQFPLRPNSSVVLLDNDANKMYIKTCDNIGMCDVRCFEFTEITQPKVKNTIAETYVTRDEFKHLHDDIDKLIMKLGVMNNEPISTDASTTEQQNQYYNANDTEQTFSGYGQGY